MLSGAEYSAAEAPRYSIGVMLPSRNFSHSMDPSI